MSNQQHGTVCEYTEQCVMYECQTECHKRTWSQTVHKDIIIMCSGCVHTTKLMFNNYNIFIPYSGKISRGPIFEDKHLITKIKPKLEIHMYVLFKVYNGHE